jgi:uncharacterized protein YjbI with pentapeptide repeats
VRHDLRTQLNQIIGYSDLLVDEARQRKLDDLLPDLEKIHTAGLRLLGLINAHVDPVTRRADNAGTDLPGTDLPGTDLPGTDLPGTDHLAADNVGADNAAQPTQEPAQCHDSDAQR